MLRRIAVVGDELITGGQVEPYQGPNFTYGNSGHQVALIGGQAYCEQCRSTGAISKAGGPRRMNFIGEIALDGDVVLCNCATPPRIVAKLAGESWCDDDAEHYDKITQSAVLVAAGSNEASRYDEQFTLRDANGRMLADAYYTIRFPSGSIAHGVTDGLGRTMRYKTNGAQNIVLYLGHREE